MISIFSKTSHFSKGFYFDFVKNGIYKFQTMNVFQPIVEFPINLDMPLMKWKNKDVLQLSTP